MFMQPERLVGTWRRFGVAGPVYEIVGVGQEAPGGERIIASGSSRAVRKPTTR